MNDTRQPSYPSRPGFHLEGPGFLTIRFRTRWSEIARTHVFDGLDAEGNGFVTIRQGFLVPDGFSGSGPSYTPNRLQWAIEALQATQLAAFTVEPTGLQGTVPAPG